MYYKNGIKAVGGNKSVTFTVEKGDTYTKDLYYDTEDKEYFVVFNSFFEGSFLTVEEYLDEDEVKKYMDK